MKTRKREYSRTEKYWRNANRGDIASFAETDERWIGQNSTLVTVASCHLAFKCLPKEREGLRNRRRPTSRRRLVEDRLLPVDCRRSDTVGFDDPFSIIRSLPLRIHRICRVTFIEKLSPIPFPNKALSKIPWINFVLQYLLENIFQYRSLVTDQFLRKMKNEQIAMIKLKFKQRNFTRDILFFIRW